MELKYPEIHIKRNWMLEEPALMVAKQIDPFLEDHKKLFFPPEKLEEKICEYRLAWARYEGWMMRGMCDILGLQFRHNIIDVHIVTAWTSAMSFPLIIPAWYSVEQFPHTLTHELLHVLFTYNAQKVNSFDVLEKMLPAEMTANTTRNHVLVQAAHKCLLLETLVRPDLLKTEIERCDKHPNYKASWDYVERIGYRKLIAQYRELAGLGPLPT